MRKLMIAATIAATSPAYANNIGWYTPPSDTYVNNYVYIQQPYQQPYRVIEAPPQVIYRYVQPGRDPQTGQCYDLDLC